MCIFINIHKVFLKTDGCGEKGGVQSCKIQLRKHIVGVLGKRHRTISGRLRNPFKATKLIKLVASVITDVCVQSEILMKAHL